MLFRSIDPAPSDNIYLNDVFPSDVYHRLISSLPDDDAYDFINHPDAVLPDGRRTRKLLDLTDETIARLDTATQDFWCDLRQVLTSPLLLTALMSKFRRKVVDCFGVALPEMVMTPILYRDFPGYRIGIHPDAPVKIATLQFYLPRDETQLHLGTSFHLRGTSGFHCLKTNPFRPNSAYAFFRTDNSWHSVRQMAAHEAVRNTLALTVYIKGTEYRSTRSYQ